MPKRKPVCAVFTYNPASIENKPAEEIIKLLIKAAFESKKS